MGTEQCQNLIVGSGIAGKILAWRPGKRRKAVEIKRPITNRLCPSAPSCLANSDDFELMKRIEQRDPAALALLYDRYAGLVFVRALRMLRDRGEAEELVSDVFLELWWRADRYDPNRAAAMSYVITLARSRAIDRQRRAAIRSRGRVAVEVVADAPCRNPNPSEFAISLENARQVRDALRNLDPVCRQAVDLSFFDGLSHAQIARRLNKPLGTVKTYIRQGLIRLRDSLRMHGGDMKRT